MAPLLGVLYLASELSDLPFVPFDVFDQLTRSLPGSIVTFGVDAMIDTLRFLDLGVADAAKTAERAIAVLQFLFGGMVGGALYFMYVGPVYRRKALLLGATAGALAGVITAVISIGIAGSTAQPVFVLLWLIVAFALWGVALGEAYVRMGPGKPGPINLNSSIPNGTTMSRRQFVVKVGSAAAVITVASTGLGNVLAGAARRELEAELQTSVPEPPTSSTPEPIPNATGTVIPATGTRTELTPLDNFYSVSIGTRSIEIDRNTWTLPITGEVANPVTLNLSDIRANYERMTHYVTLSCISGRIGSELIGTTKWTGVSLQQILAQVQPSADARYLDISSADGFHESVDLQEIDEDERLMLCFEWDGRPLPLEHGFPLRIWRPDRYGMKQPRWITGMEISSEPREGYWVRRGWDAVAQVQATSVIDTVASDSIFEVDGQSFVPVGGIAFSGAREVSKVEVRVDGGEWQAAQLRTPLSGTTWVIWRYDWPFTEGDHEFEVRCMEGDGTPQIEESRGNRPSGATGIHSRKAKV